MPSTPCSGPREAVWHAIIRRNHGCTHFIVGRDHAAPGADRRGRRFHGPYDAQGLRARHEAKLGIAMVPFQEVVYVENRKCYLPVDWLGEEDRPLRLSGAELRRRLASGRDLPDWFTFPEVLDIRISGVLLLLPRFGGCDTLAEMRYMGWAYLGHSGA